MEEIKEWHILDFPDTIYIKINDNYRKKLFNQLSNKFGSKRKTAKFLEIDLRTLLDYERGFTIRNKIKYSKAIPIGILKKIINPKNQSKLEKNIISINKIRTEINNLKLPIKESSEIYRIIAHLICDGTGGGKYHQPYYCNNCKILREQFKKDLQVFGNIKTKEIKVNPTLAVTFPKIISRMLEHFFQNNFTNPNKLPKRIFNTTKKYKIEFLKAIYDDEGTISPHLTISMKSLNIIKKIKYLVNSLNIQTSKIVKKTNPNENWAFSILKTEYQKFKKEIGFYHPNKYNNLKNIIKIQNIKYKFTNEFKNKLHQKIIKILKEKNYTTIEMSHRLLLNYTTTLNRLKILESKNLVKRNGYKNKIIWSFKDVSTPLPNMNSLPHHQQLQLTNSS